MDTEDRIQDHTAQVIKTWRKDIRNMSQSALAEALGMHQTAIAKIENNERRVDFATVVRISEILNIPWEQFRVGTPDDKQKVVAAVDNYLAVSTDWLRHMASMHNASIEHAKALATLTATLKEFRISEGQDHKEELTELANNAAKGVLKITDLIMGATLPTPPDTASFYEGEKALKQLRNSLAHHI